MKLVATDSRVWSETMEIMLVSDLFPVDFSTLLLLPLLPHYQLEWHAIFTDDQPL